MKKILAGIIALAVLTATPVCAKDRCMNKFEKKSEEIIEKFEKHLRKIRSNDELSPEMKTLLVKQAKETMGMKLRHLKEKTDLRRKQKRESAMMRQSPDSLANAPNDNDWYVEEEEIDVYTVPVEETDVLPAKKVKRVKNPNRHKSDMSD